MDGGSSPGTTKVSDEALRVQQQGDGGFGHAGHHEEPVDTADEIDLLGRPGDQDHSIRLQALLLATGQHALGLAALVDQHAA